MTFNVILTCLLFCVVSTFAYECKNLRTQVGIDIEQMKGKWNVHQMTFEEIPRTPKDSVKNSSLCLRFDVKDFNICDHEDEGSYEYLTTMHMNIPEPFESLYGVSFPNAEVAGIVKVTVLSEDFEGEEVEVHILHTDHDTMLAAMCYDAKGLLPPYIGYIAMMSRSNTPLPVDVVMAYKYIMSIYGIQTPFVEIDHMDCGSKKVFNVPILK